MSEYPDASRLMAGELGEWLGGQRVTRRLAIEKSNNRIFNVAVIVLPALAAAWIFGLHPWDIPFTVWILAGAFAWAWTQKPKRDAKKRVKTGINEAIAASLGMTYAHDCEASDAFETCNSYRLFPSHDRKKFEDLWTGDAGGRPFMLQEVKLDERQGSGDNQRWETVFRGALIEIGFEDRFHGTTLLVRDGKFSKFFGGAKDSMTFDGEVLERIQVVNPDFEDQFDIYSSDRTEAHYLVHPEYIERLIAIEEAFAGDDVTAILTGGSIIIAVNAGDMFESGSLDHSEDHFNVERTIDQFARLHDMALTLNRIRPDRAA